MILMNLLKKLVLIIQYEIIHIRYSKFCGGYALCSSCPQFDPKTNHCEYFTKLDNISKKINNIK
jgi:hypothetical protein